MSLSLLHESIGCFLWRCRSVYFHESIGCFLWRCCSVYFHETMGASCDDVASRYIWNNIPYKYMQTCKQSSLQFHRNSSKTDTSMTHKTVDGFRRSVYTCSSFITVIILYLDTITLSRIPWETLTTTISTKLKYNGDLRSMSSFATTHVGDNLSPMSSFLGRYLQCLHSWDGIFNVFIRGTVSSMSSFAQHSGMVFYLQCLHSHNTRGWYFIFNDFIRTTLGDGILSSMSLFAQHSGMVFYLQCLHSHNTRGWYFIFNVFIRTNTRGWYFIFNVFIRTTLGDGILSSVCLFAQHTWVVLYLRRK